MTDELLTDLIVAMAAARADGDGVLTLDALRKRLEEAKLTIGRTDSADAVAVDPLAGAR
jgi:hypothetical protein